MTDTPSLIERGAQALHRRNGFVPWEKVTEPAREAYRKDALAVLEESGALSLTVSPLPDEIAGLIERIKFWVLKEGQTYTDHPVEYAFSEIAIEAAAALERMARENERLHERLEDNHEFHLKDGQMVRVEVEPGSIPDGIECRDETIKLQDERIDRQNARIRELEAERNGHKQAYTDLVEEVRSLRNEAYEQGKGEADAIRAKTIEDASQKMIDLAKKYERLDDPIAAEAFRLAEFHIRALNQQKPETETE